MIENCVGNLADFTLDYIKDKSTFRFSMTQAKIRVIQKRYQDAVSCLDSILKNDEKNQQAWILRGHAYFLAGNLFDSEESYIKALRLKPVIKDQTL